MECSYTKEELSEMIAGMKLASSVFYAQATSIGNHAFIEFCGFMNEYIKMCESTLASGKDFTTANVHSGSPLVQMKDYEAAYVGEKFGCIFASSFAGKPELIEAFCAEAFATKVKVEAHDPAPSP